MIELKNVESEKKTVAPKPEKRVLPTKKDEKKKGDFSYQRDKDRQLVKGVFKFYEVPGGSLGFSFKKYKEDPIERYDFVDGEVYSIPLGVAKHLNKNGKYPVHAYKMDEEGKPTKAIGQMVSRFGFQSLEFMDPDDLDESPIVQMVEMKP